MDNPLLDKLKHHVTGAIERGEAEAIVSTEADPLEQFLAKERKWMLLALKSLVRDCKRSIRQDRVSYIENDGDEPSIDIRLCIDKPKGLSDRIHPPANWTWVFNTGDASYDQYHSDYCAASTIGLDDNAEELLEELIGDL